MQFYLHPAVRSEFYPAESLWMAPQIDFTVQVNVALLLVLSNDDLLPYLTGRTTTTQSWFVVGQRFDESYPWHWRRLQKGQNSTM